ncbi:unnamed protein product [Microthlaspi erraticum]|uniref:Cystatin domain-containing protein n=1 Tax=Microthlaspi erraticum TaxID=1685480 RepID=A0A6D2IUE4_9BRAS|nr:unnamed protein product [Microthlaspi erraticum]
MTSTESTDVTAAKRHSETEEETHNKKPKMEDEDGVNLEEGGDCEEEFDDAGAKAKPKGYLKYPPAREVEPEWDKDSFDDLDEFVPNPESRGYFQNDEDYQEFCESRKQALKDRGFLPDEANNIYPIVDLEEPWTTQTTTREYLADLARLCVKKLNEEEGSTVEFLSVVRGNICAGGRWKLYITFMAREHPGGDPVEYQAKAMDFAGGYNRPPFPILCRPAPLNR